ncbi:YbaB/EbfC family nucleoid-associated protein [Rhodococcus sp. IEGM 1408]|uniref:YbaB/EbfC family nucleoid-associated protein n=1 Tax=Rhodococcus sp. IEGM 1408 TaxID=3082220 RepID=UPI002952F519|nr:YbaB/EbfC family nucleoid-associated protein [Rhodococcus sp. IEGM 1408]MDV8000916.1 YbaB/EbfC family nucleoid-associated protein [Rhodococcus sp. IEGM 1408]
MSGGGLDVDAFLGRLRGIAAEWESAHDQLETLRVVASSRDQLATATADSGGSVVDLALASGLRRHGSEVVAAAILEATSDAVEQANARRAELVSGSVALAVSGRKRDAESAARGFGGAAVVGRGTT